MKIGLERKTGEGLKDLTRDVTSSFNEEGTPKLLKQRCQNSYESLKQEEAEEIILSFTHPFVQKYSFCTKYMKYWNTALRQTKNHSGIVPALMKVAN